MKKVITFVLLFIPCLLIANDNWKYRAAVNYGFYYGDSDLDATTPVLSVEYGYIYKERLLLGIGAGIEWIKTPADGRSIKKSYIPIYADIKYYAPLGEKVKFLAGVETGYCFNRDVKRYYHTKKVPNEFLFYPQIGLDIKLYKNLSLEVSGGCRSGYMKQWGFNVGVRF